MEFHIYRYLGIYLGLAYSTHKKSSISFFFYLFLFIVSSKCRAIMMTLNIFLLLAAIFYGYLGIWFKSAVKYKHYCGIALRLDTVWQTDWWKFVFVFEEEFDRVDGP